MAETTPVTEHVHRCVKLLNQELHRIDRYHPPVSIFHHALESVFELLDVPWDELAEGDELFREGYETCLLDVIEHIAQEWHIELPVLKKVAS